jgi:hypothetical protein
MYGRSELLLKAERHTGVAERDLQKAPQCWKDAVYATEITAAMKVVTTELLNIDVANGIIPESNIDAHWSHHIAANALKRFYCRTNSCYGNS